MFLANPCQSPPTGVCAKSADHASDAGYSLIEMVVSLAILALAASIIMPNAVDMVQRFQAQADMRSIIDQIQSQRQQAISSGQARVLQAGTWEASQTFMDLPAGWRLELDAPLAFSQAGVCQGEGVTIITPDGRRRYYSLDARTCRLEGS